VIKESENAHYPFCILHSSNIFTAEERNPHSLLLDRWEKQDENITFYCKPLSSIPDTYWY
jgi:hypothetical protein